MMLSQTLSSCAYPVPLATLQGHYNTVPLLPPANGPPNKCQLVIDPHSSAVCQVGYLKADVDPKTHHYFSAHGESPPTLEYGESGLSYFGHGNILSPGNICKASSSATQNDSQDTALD
jgi:hypothetical protein